MSMKLLQINVKLHEGGKRDDEGWRHAAQAIAQQPGLVWKIWIGNAKTGEAGGWYLFESGEHAQAYLDGDLIAAFRQNPAFSKVSIKLFDPNLEASEITRGLLALNVLEDGSEKWVFQAD